MSLRNTVLAATVALAACQPLPQPFRPDAKDGVNRLLVRNDIGGVVVRPVEGLAKAQSDALADAMVDALHKSEIPAATSGGNLMSLHLDGTATERPGNRIAVAWRLTDPAGRQVGTAEAEGTPADPASLAAHAAPKVAALVEGTPAKPKADPAAVRGAPPMLTVWPVVGAPGDGDPALSRAMHDALKAAEVPVSDELTDHGLVIAGSVHVGPAEPGSETVEILWTVLDSTGTEVAKLAQNNTVPKGSLDGEWGPLARMIADSAIPGVIDMLRQLPPGRASGG